MKLSDFLKCKLPYIVCHASVAIITVSMLLALNPWGGSAFSILIGAVYISGAIIPLVMEYRKKSVFYNLLVRSYDQLDRKNLIAEIIPEPDFFEGALLYDILKSSNKACLEEINSYKALQEEYREYIEMWVHEIKTPISSSKLIIQNRSDESSDSIAEELDSIERYVEQALFYARSSAVEKDYIIRELNLEKTVYAAFKKNAKQLIGANISVSTDNLDVSVYSDSKWLEFILNQLIINSIKYARDTEAHIEIKAEEMDNCCILSIADNGLGIPENEVQRIFDKGFTGTNGRLRGKSTGMGLYICKKLCVKLGASISAESVQGSGTTISIVFPKSSMTDIV